MGDKPRLLARRSELGYTTSSSQALAGSGEAVPEEVQDHLTAQATRRAQDRRHAELEVIRQRLVREVDQLAAQLRRKERELRRVEQRLDR
jgi:hypothetical protein